MINAASEEKVTYFNAGGLGGLIGNGMLTQYRHKKTIETFYVGVIKNVRLTGGLSVRRQSWLRPRPGLHPQRAVSRAVLTQAEAAC